MQAIELIGQVAANFLKRALSTDELTDGIARFLLDRLTGQQVAGICHKILLDPQLSELIRIQVPRALVQEFSLPNEILTDQSTVHLRHAACDRPALLLANASDDQAQSLNDITPLGSQELKGQVDIWIYIAAQGLPIPNEQVEYWRKALSGLQKVGTPSLEHFAQYIVDTRNRIENDGVPVIEALGWALSALRLPRDSGYFRAIPETQWGQTQRWEKQFNQAFTKRGCLLIKQTPNRKSIDEQDLQNAFDKVKEDIPEIAYPAITAFISSPAGWHSEAAALTKFEWETDSISSLFSGLQVQKTDIASLTLEFYSDEYPDTLTETEVQYLNILKKRSKKEALDEDREFYDSHRHELDTNRQLKAKWDKFVYGQPIECNDFLIGLLQVFERLFDQAESIEGIKTLKISTQKSSRKSTWLELNADIGIYFCIKYRGIEKLTNSFIQWDTHYLFKYDSLLEETRNKQKDKYRQNTSTAKSATEIKFYIEMREQAQTQILIGKTQLIWRCSPSSVGMELHNDLERLSRNTFLISQVSRELVSKKGRLQGISLSDVGTLMAAYRQDRGSLIGKNERKNDLEKTLPTKLKEAVKDGRLSRQASETILITWKEFTNSYKQAITSFINSGSDGIASPYLLHQCEAYNKLLTTVLTYAKGDRNRIDFYQPILRLGCVRVERGKPAAIIAPWHPLRLASIAVKARQVAGLLRYLSSHTEVNFGDSRLFFADLRNDLSHAYYPEVCIGYQGQQPELLAISDTVNDYSLMEFPIKDESERFTNENPAEAAEKLLGLIHRYVELQPHEQTNLSVMLYQTDSIKLPQAIVSKLGEELQDNADEVRCQVILRHRNAQKLGQIYEQILESSNTDPDAFIASEVSQNFMARLRIAVMSTVPPVNSREGKFADIVFLQDAISRQAKVNWQFSPFSENADILTHFPARWSRKRPAAKDELKSTLYLTCPKQPAVSQVYLDMVYSIISGEDSLPGKHFLPARQISFQEETTKTIFEEIHRLGEWVVNYDDLLERRQLLNQGVKVIRYQQNRADKRNFLVSSDTSLNLLQVLVRKRLESLNLGISKEQTDRLVEQFIDEANEISGDIVLRSAKCGRFASELMGIVLSKALIKAEMGEHNHIGWYFLDDYASWLGQKEGQIADILAVSLQHVDNEPLVKIIISEAKYVDVAGLADARKTSQKQLRDTVERIANALFINPSRLDRDLWLSRLSDLILEGIEFSADAKLPIEQWQEVIREGTVKIDLSGYSHIFITGTSDSSIESERIPIVKANRCFQEVFNKELVRKLVICYEANQSLFLIREQIDSDKPWLITQPKLPASRVTWVLDIEEANKINSQNLVQIEEKLCSEDDNLNQLQMNLVNSSITSNSLINSEKVNNVWVSPNLASWSQLQKLQASQSDNVSEQWLTNITSQLRTALMGYSLQAKVLGQRLTPNSAIIRLKGSDNLRIEDIEKRRSPLLTTHGLQVINITGQPGEIHVAIARPQRETVFLYEAWSKRKLNRMPSGVNLSFIIGINELNGELLYLNLGSNFENLQQHAPHTLIAGATGSGKSVLLRNLLLDIVATNSPDLVHIYLIDTKAGTDYFPLEDLPHFKEGIIIEQEHAIEIFEQIVEEMDRRYQQFREQKVNSLLAYNQKVSSEEKLPIIFLVHDEFADWMLVEIYKNSVASAVQRLGIKARAAGIHLVFAAQRPDVNVFPIQLRDNLGNRLVLRVESEGTSEIALGRKGAEHLLGRGHLAARLSGETDLIYAQVPFLSDEDFSDLVNVIK